MCNAQNWNDVWNIVMAAVIYTVDTETHFNDVLVLDNIKYNVVGFKEIAR